MARVILLVKVDKSILKNILLRRPKVLAMGRIPPAGRFSGFRIHYNQWH